MNGDGDTDLEDAVLTLKVLSGMKTDSVHLSADANGDMKIGFEELVFILRKIAEM
ncbi:MAG: hypothetical protein GY749_17135 [Desulfobacteraceae bacterium]|nr:hypothetical protein [Desulfobacteraceae bacterium]